MLEYPDLYYPVLTSKDRGVGIGRCNMLLPLSRTARVAPVSPVTQTADALLEPVQVRPDKMSHSSSCWSRSNFLIFRRFGRVYRQVDERFDVRCNALTTLVMDALQNNGKVSKNRRKQFLLTVPVPVFDTIEQVCEQPLK